MIHISGVSWVFYTSSCDNMNCSEIRKITDEQYKVIGREKISNFLMYFTWGISYKIRNEVWESVTMLYYGSKNEKSTFRYNLKWPENINHLRMYNTHVILQTTDWRFECDVVLKWNRNFILNTQQILNYV